MLHLLRHGEVYNPSGVLYGRLPDFHLSEEGRLMAKAAAAFLAGRDVTVLRSSPLDRALETAAPLAAQFGLDVVTDERLIEPANVFEGTTVGVGSGALRNPANWRYLYDPFRPSWGEPYTQVAARMRAAMTDAARAARGHEAVLRQPPAADLGRPAGGRGQASVAQPGAPAVCTGQRDQLQLHRGQDHRGRLRRAGRARPPADRGCVTARPARCQPGRPHRAQWGAVLLL